MIALEASKIIGGALKGDPNAVFVCVDDLKGNKRGALSFIAEPSYLHFLKGTVADVLVVEKNIATTDIDDWCSKKGKACILIDGAYRAFIKLIYSMYPGLRQQYMVKHQLKMVSDSANIAKDAVIHQNVFLGDNVEIGERTIIYPGVVILNNAKIGSDVILYPNVSIYHDVKIGNRVIVGSGSVIGSDGFGFVKDIDGSMLKVPHLGAVTIDDDVEIGSNTSIDRGTLVDTHIKKGTKIDNLVQIAHNCIVGENNILCGSVGLSGSTELGNNVVMAARSGTKGHIKIGDNCVITALTNISKDLEAGKTVKGIYPARPIEEELKIQTLVGKLPEIYERLRKLEKENKK